MLRSINKISQGQYLISTSMIGYTAKYIPVAISDEIVSLDLPPIRMEENVADLKEVVVKARKPLFEQQIDRM